MKLPASDHSHSRLERSFSPWRWMCAANRAPGALADLPRESALRLAAYSPLAWGWYLRPPTDAAGLSPQRRVTRVDRDHAIFSCRSSTIPSTSAASAAQTPCQMCPQNGGHPNLFRTGHSSACPSRGFSGGLSARNPPAGGERVCADATHNRLAGGPQALLLSSRSYVLAADRCHQPQENLKRIPRPLGPATRVIGKPWASGIRPRP